MGALVACGILSSAGCLGQGLVPQPAPREDLVGKVVTGVLALGMDLKLRGFWSFLTGGRN